MKICEVFRSIQGEGRFVGFPMLFIRFSGCTRNCGFCDSKYHNIVDKTITYNKIICSFNKTKIICFTGGEPLLQRDVIRKIIIKDPTYIYHLETNGDLLTEDDMRDFSYISISPKDEETAGICSRLINKYSLDVVCDIKVVTDLDTVGKNILKYATILMPLTTDSATDNLEISRKVWRYCVKKGIRFSPRIHFDIWDRRRAV